MFSTDRTALLAALAAAAGGCFSPNLADPIRCDESGLCPPGLTCQADGVCREGLAPGPDAPPGVAVLESLLLSAPAELDPPFSPGVFDYNLEVSVLVQELRVQAAGRGDATVTLGGVELDPETPSEPIALPNGLTTVELEVTAPGRDPSTYTIDVGRGAEIEQYLYAKASNPDSLDDFGRAVAVSGGLMAASAPFEDSATVGIGGDEDNNDASLAGAVYVFARVGSVWTQEKYLKASNTEAGDRFGTTLAIDGDTLVVSAPFEDSMATGVNGDQTNNEAAASGAVYVFRRTAPGEWRQEAYLKASNTGASDLFGSSLALSGDTLAVGASGEDSAATGVNGDQTSDDAAGSGAVYVFRRSGETWSQEAYLKASNTGASDAFGTAVAVSGDTLAVGAPFEDSAASGIGGDQASDAALSSGAVYVFRRSNDGWAQEAYVKSSTSDMDGADRFGTAVSLDGDHLVVGAPLEDSSAVGVDGNQLDDAASASGAAYVFSHDPDTGWAQDAYLKASNTGASDTFGERVALAGELLAVSADGEDSAAAGINGNQNNNDASAAGALYLFRLDGAGWRQIAYVKSSNPDAFDDFSFGMALSRDTLVGATAFEDGASAGLQGDPANNDASATGAAFVFR